MYFFYNNQQLLPCPGPLFMPVITVICLCYSCVLIELFSEGKVPFTLSQLLSYRSGDYSPWKILDMVTDRNIKVISNYMMSNSVTLLN